MRMFVLECPPRSVSRPETGALPTTGRSSEAASSALSARNGVWRVQRSRGMSKHRGDGVLDIFRLGGGGEPVHDVAVAVDQELGEVPLDVLGAQDAALLALQVVV